MPTEVMKAKDTSLSYSHTQSYQMPCEAENPNVPVVLGLAYDPAMHACNWPDLLTSLGCDPAERLGGFQCPVLRGLDRECNLCT